MNLYLALLVITNHYYASWHLVVRDVVVSQHNPCIARVTGTARMGIRYGILVSIATRNQHAATITRHSTLHMLTEILYQNTYCT